MASEPILTPNSPCSRSSVAPYCERVRALVTPRRWAHIERVAILAETIARANGFREDEVRATALAAVLHDAARDLPDERLLDLAPPANATERAHPITLHGRAGRALAASWGVTDERVLNAIEGHVFGVPPGDRIGMAVYVADVSEPGRGVNDEVRELAMRTLPRAYRRAVRSKVDYLRSRGKPVHPTTLEVHDQILADAT
jgi:predicted HD superfamily hydrolase involved in NAD metabolism